MVAGPEALAPRPRCCLCPTRPRFAPGVTIEEDNCCGCNAIAIRRHFLDENMSAVDIVYTSCHDAVRGWAGWAGLACSTPGFCPLQAMEGQAGLQPRVRSRWPRALGARAVLPGSGSPWLCWLCQRQPPGVP